jgi:hypothetical protein
LLAKASRFMSHLAIIGLVWEFNFIAIDLVDWHPTSKVLLQLQLHTLALFRHPVRSYYS